MPTAMTPAQSERKAADQASTWLRDRRSASTPANPDTMTYGMKPSDTVIDTQRPDPVRASTSTPTAMGSIRAAVVATPWLISSRRKLAPARAERKVGGIPPLYVRSSVLTRANSGPLHHPHASQKRSPSYHQGQAFLGQCAGGALTERTGHSASSRTRWA